MTRGAGVVLSTATTLLLLAGPAAADGADRATGAALATGAINPADEPYRNDWPWVYPRDGQYDGLDTQDYPGFDWPWA